MFPRRYDHKKRRPHIRRIFINIQIPNYTLSLIHAKQARQKNQSVEFSKTSLYFNTIIRYEILDTRLKELLKKEVLLLQRHYPKNFIQNGTTRSIVS